MKKIFLNILRIVFVLLLILGVLYFKSKDKKINISEDTDKITGVVENKEKVGACTRTTRLENSPYLDRALSLIEEKYKSWENSTHNYYTVFSAQLTNCIKVVEDETIKVNNVEGYFIFDDEKISKNYFPIYINKRYRYSDEAVNAMLLVHEITHVQQYIDKVNDKTPLSCVDKEVEAFNAQYNFIMNLSGEYIKSVNLRIDNDEYLNPQLQIIKAIRQQYVSNGLIVSIKTNCINGGGGEDCLNNDQKIKIKEIISKEDTYKEQCGLE